MNGLRDRVSPTIDFRVSITCISYKTDQRIRMWTGILSPCTSGGNDTQVPFIRLSLDKTDFTREDLDRRCP